MTDHLFPPGFVWGAATSSYQIEGSPRADGKGVSIWDTFTQRPGVIEDGSSGDVACDHYRLWESDIDLMAELGLGAYRFSVAWPRVLPGGDGPVNPAGLDFYDRLVDRLLECGIEPWVTLYHWDLPQTLEDRGGWPSRDTALAFAAYAGIVADRLGDRVNRWVTVNEPWVVAKRGYFYGDKAPGHHDATAAVRASHHLLLGHGLAVRAIREVAPHAHVGITLNLTPVEAASTDPADVEAARRFDGDANRWFLDPIFGRGYPDDVLRDYADAGWLDGATSLASVADHDLISARQDFLGVNYYERTIIRDSRGGSLPAKVVPADAEITEMGWEVFPAGLTDVLVGLTNEYGPTSIVVTENGCSFGDAPGDDGRVRDERRIVFLRDHLAAAHDAVRAGVPLDGYFAWSLMDNFEWARGYRQRFGLVWVDFETQQRIPKDSAGWYRAVVAANGLVRDQ
jgi:beta-glucosidase